MKPVLLALILTFLSSIAHAQAVPKPVEPSPTLPKSSANQERHTYIDRPYKSANSETYTTKKVPLDKSKMGKWFKKLPKPDMISIGILALGQAVDYVLDPENNTAQFDTSEYVYYDSGGREFNSVDEIVKHHCTNNQSCMYGHHIIKDRSYRWELRGINTNRDNVFVTHIQISKKKQKQTEIPLDDLADKLIDSAKKGNPDAKKWVQDWADDEVRTNPNAYPEHQPSPQPNPKDEPQTEPRPKPSPDTSPNAQPQPNPSETIKPCEKGYYRTAHGFCVPDPAYNPDKDTKDNPKPSDEPRPNPNTDPSSQPNPKDKEQKPFELPAFCDWAGVVCDFIDWFKDNPDLPEPQQVQIDDNQLTKTAQSFDTDYLRFGGQCPAPISHTIAVGNQHSVFTVDLTPLCQFVLLVRPAILAMAYLLAIGIVSNAIKDS